MQGARRSSLATGSAPSDSGDDGAQAGIVDLAAQVLEKALELVDRAIGGGQELGRVEGAGSSLRSAVDLGLQLAPEALDLAAHLDRVAALEASAELIGLAEDPRRDRAGPVAQLDDDVGEPLREVSRSLRVTAKRPRRGRPGCRWAAPSTGAAGASTTVGRGLASGSFVSAASIAR